MREKINGNNPKTAKSRKNGETNSSPQRLWDR